MLINLFEDRVKDVLGWLIWTFLSEKVLNTRTSYNIVLLIRLHGSDKRCVACWWRLKVE